MDRKRTKLELLFAFIINATAIYIALAIYDCVFREKDFYPCIHFASLH